MEANTTFNYVNLTDKELQTINGGGITMKSLLFAYTVGHAAGEIAYNITH